MIIDQFIDRTNGRKATFYEKGVVGHVGFSKPVCTTLAKYLLESAKEVRGAGSIHAKGTYVNMEGPAFSTVAESHLYRSWHADVVGMTTLTEAKLAREAEISYGVLAMATDYDCWQPDHDAVTVEFVIQTMEANVKKAQEIVKVCVKKIAKHAGPCPQANAMRGAIMTDPSKIPAQTLVDLQPLIGKYFPVRQEPEPSLFGFGLFSVFTLALAVLASRK